MDLHIERPELTAKTAEENIATVDTWIADTADKLNIALKSVQSSTESTLSDSASRTEVGVLKARVPYLGDYKVKATTIILGG